MLALVTSDTRLMHAHLPCLQHVAPIDPCTCGTTNALDLNQKVVCLMMRYGMWGLARCI